MSKVYRFSQSTSFNSRPREGATCHFCTRSVSLKVSIHAPVRGRLKSDATSISSSCFNSRPREGATVIIRNKYILS